MSDFVLVLLVKGREPFTERWLEYMSKINFKYKIAIGNGNKKSDKYIKKLINKKKYSNLNIEYYSYNNKNYKDYYYMMYDVVRKQKKTKFIKFCDNDDFILPFQLENLIKLIKKDKKSISIGDRCMWFSLIGNKIYNKKIHFWPDNFYRLSESFNIKDVKKIFIEFQESFYNIFKKKYILQILKEIHEINFSDLEIRDFYLKLRLMAFGKTKFYNQISYVRQHGTSETSVNNFLYTRNFTTRNISGDVNNLKKYLFKNIKINTLSKNLIKDEIDKGYVNYLNNVVSHNLRAINKKKLFVFKEFLNKKFPTILNLIRKTQYFKDNFLIQKKYYKDFDKFKIELKFIQIFLKKN